MPDRPKYTPWLAGAASSRAGSVPVREPTPATPSAPPQPVLTLAPVETTTGPSEHPEAVKARRWRGRRRLQRQGHVMVEVAVSPAQLRGLHALGLVRAISRFLDAAEPLSRVAGALDSSNPP